MQIQIQIQIQTRLSKLCGFCIFHNETCEPLIEKWLVCYAFFNVSENGKANYQNTNTINVNIWLKFLKAEFAKKIPSCTSSWETMKNNENL